MFETITTKSGKQVTLRPLDDVADMRQAVLDNVLAAVKRRSVIENERHRLELVDVAYDDTTAPTIAQQKEAIMKNKTIAHRIRGTWNLVDKATGAVLDSKPATVAALPALTNRGTMIYHGSEYVIGNQLRLRPGPYTRVANNGEVETHVNVIAGTGMGFRVKLDPETGKFVMRVGQANLPLYPVMKAIGVNDDTLKQAWGDQLFAVNQKTDDPKVLDKLYEKLVPNGKPGDDRLAAIRAQFERMRVDPEVSEHNLGKYISKPPEFPQIGEEK